MAGLREKQKIKRANSIVDAALHLFATKGYDAVKLEEVAQLADVSAGSVYTYFSTKSNLLLAIVVNDFDTAFRYGEAVINAPITNAEDAINALTHQHIYEAEGGVTRDMWRIAIAASIRDPRSSFSIRYNKCLSQLRAQYHTLVVRLQAEGYLPGSVNTDMLTDMLCNNLNMQFLEFIRHDRNQLSKLEVNLKKANGTLVQWVRQAGKPADIHSRSVAIAD